MNFRTKIYFKLRERKLISRYMKKLRANEDIVLINERSKEAYDNYDSVEQEQYENGSKQTLHNGRIERVKFKLIRSIYLQEIYDQIDEMISLNPDRPVSVLEVGCGNCINAMSLLEKYGSKIAYTGFDLSAKRIEVSKDYWGSKLDGASFSEMSATNIAFKDNSFDLVFSMHVLEQITYEVGSAIDEMLRVASKRVVFIEPTYEFGNTAQRLKLVLNDQLRTLLPEINKRNLNVVKSYPCKTLANPTNPTGIHVVHVSD